MARNKKVITASKLESEESILIDFSFPTSLVSVKTDQFNNYLKDDDEAFKKVNFCLNDLTSFCAQYYPRTLKKQSHCHLIQQADKIRVIEKAVKAAYLKINRNCDEVDAKNFYDQNFKDATLFQIGVQQDTRLIGYFENGHHFKVILIDYHHQLYPSTKHNNVDCSHFNVCVFERGHKHD